jgi:hypothetical protein
MTDTPLTTATAILIAEAKSRCLSEDRGCHPDDEDWNGCYVCVHRAGLAQALRTAVNHVIPEEPLHGGNQRWQFERDTRQACRRQFLDIADALAPPR